MAGKIGMGPDAHSPPEDAPSQPGTFSDIDVIPHHAVFQSGMISDSASFAEDHGPGQMNRFAEGGPWTDHRTSRQVRTGSGPGSRSHPEILLPLPVAGETLL